MQTQAKSEVNKVTYHLYLPKCDHSKCESTSIKNESPAETQQFLITFNSIIYFLRDKVRQ